MKGDLNVENNNKKIWLRKFTEQDLDFLLSVNYFKSPTKEFVMPVLNDWIKGESEGHLRFSRCIMLDNKPIGVISLGEKEKGVVGFGISILEKFRGNGYATIAFNLAKEELKEKNIKKIKSSCGYSNIASKALHKKLGFTLNKTEINPAGNKMNRYELEL